MAFPARTIVIGGGTYTFTGDDVVSISSVENESILGSELAYDTLSVEVVCPSSINLATFKATPYGTAVRYYLDGTLTGYFYLDKMKRVSERGFQLECISAIGLLDRENHAGGIYKGTAFSSVLSDIIGGSFSYATPNTTLNNTKIYGYLPFDTKRNNLRRLLLAVNAHVFKRTSDMCPSFQPLSQSSSGTISQDNQYIDYQEDVPQIASKVTVTEHAYFYDSRADEVELFNNSAGYAVSSYMVTFGQAPIYQSSIHTEDSGLTIEETHCNYAIVSGRGVLKGIPYAHTTYDVIRTNPAAEKSYEVSIIDDGLISIANSEMVADRLLEYYTSKNTISIPIVYSGESCGERRTLVNRFGETILGYLSKMKKTVSSFVKADCEFVTDYAGTAFGNSYSNVVKLTGSGSWSKPAGVTRFRAVLIGAGSGGNAGWKGEDGSLSGSGGKGGEGGTAGAAGRIYEQTFDVASAAASYAYACGTGGTAGGALINGNFYTGYITDEFNPTQSYPAFTLIKYGSYYYMFAKDYTAGDYSTYNTTATYAVGDVVLYNNLIYVCISPVVTPGSWSDNSSKFKDINTITTAYSATSSYTVGSCVQYAVPNTIYYKKYVCIANAPAGYEPSRTMFFKQIGIGRAGSSQSEVEYFYGGTGGDTTLTVAGTTYRASNGSLSDHGYIDLFNDILYAVPGLDGVKGGDGGDAGSTEQGTSSDRSTGADGEAITYNGMVYSGGKGLRGGYLALPIWSYIKERTIDPEVDKIDLKNLGFSVSTSIGGGGGGGAAAGRVGGNASPVAYSEWLSHVMKNVNDNEKYNIDSDSDYRAQEYVQNTGGLGGFGAMPLTAPAVSTEGSGGNGGHGGGGAGGVSASSTASGNVGWYKADFCPPIDAFVFMPTDFTEHYYGNYNSSYSYKHGQIVYGQYPEHPGGTLRSAQWYMCYKAGNNVWYRGDLMYISQDTFFPMIYGYVVLTNVYNGQDHQLVLCTGTAYSTTSFEIQCVPDINADNVPKRDIRNILEEKGLHGGYGSAGSAGADGCILIYY